MDVALSNDGSTALVGGQSDGNDKGAAWVFTRSGSTWKQQGKKLTGVGEVGKGYFGGSVALSNDGEIALVGGLFDNNQKGATWTFARSGSTWTRLGSKLTASPAAGQPTFGGAVALSADGKTALVGGVQDDKSKGAVWVFSRSGATWKQQGRELTGGEEIGDAEFGWRIALSDDGDTALIGGNYVGPAPAGAAWVFAR